VTTRSWGRLVLISQTLSSSVDQLLGSSFHLSDEAAGDKLLGEVGNPFFVLQDEGGNLRNFPNKLRFSGGTVTVLLNAS